MGSILSLRGARIRIDRRMALLTSRDRRRIVTTMSSGGHQSLLRSILLMMKVYDSMVPMFSPQKIGSPREAIL